jgi:hypothetical protein
MVKEKERFEVLLEEIRGDVKLVLEGHDVLNKKIDGVKRELKEEIGIVSSRVDSVGSRVDSVSKKLDVVHASLKNEIKATATAVKYELDSRITKLEAVGR